MTKKIILLLLLITLSLSGCGTWKKIRMDYLGGDKYYPSVWKDSWSRFKDYLR